MLKSIPTFVFIKRTFKKYPRFRKILFTTYSPVISFFSAFSSLRDDFHIYSTCAYAPAQAYSLFFFG